MPDKREKLFLCHNLVQGKHMGFGLTAVRAALVAVFADLVTDEGASRCAPDGADRPTENGAARHTANDGADTGANLGTRGIGSATAQCKSGGEGGGKKDVTDFHGKSPWWVGVRPRSFAADAWKLDLCLDYRCTGGPGV